jgi:hypothetical protein
MKMKIECRYCGGEGIQKTNFVGGKMVIDDCFCCEGKGKVEVEVQDNRKHNKTPIKKILESL